MRVDDRDTKRTALIGVLCAAACSNAAARGGGGAPAGVDASPGRLVGVGSTPPAAEDCPKALFGVEDSARTIRKDCGPIEVTASYLVDASLTLEAGAVLKFREGAELGVGWSKPARLIVQGTEREPVVLTSAVHDGAWKGLHPHRSAARPEINGLVVENAGGGKGAVVVEAEAVTLRGSTVRNVRGVGIFVDGAGRLADLSGNTFEKAGPVAISVPPDALGGLGPNRFDADAFVQVRGGTVESDARWPSLGAPYVFAENVRIEGKNGRATVEIGGGAELRFRAGVGLDVGGGSDGALVVAGTAERPVVFTAADEPKPGAWRGIGVHGKASVRIAGARFAFAGSDDKGAIRVEGGTAAVTGSAFADDRRALTVDDDGTLERFDDNQLGASPDPAIVLVADQVGGLGHGNRFASGARIEIAGGTVKRSATWRPQGVPYEVTGETMVDEKATLTLAPDVDLAFKDGQAFEIGYYSDGTLKAVGTAAHPVKMRGLGDKSAWKGLLLNAHALGCEIAHVELADVDGDAGIVVSKDATARVSDVSCVRCAAATLASECGARLAATDISAGDGTPKAELKPECN